MSDDIRFYGLRGEYGFLSNFYHSPFTENGVLWPTVEHYYQASKAESLIDYQIVATAPDPRTAKYHGRAIKCRDDWEIPVDGILPHMYADDSGPVVWSVKDYFMLLGLKAKFDLPQLTIRLINTGEAALIENSPTDYYWGCGKTGRGQNKLGRMLMLVRRDIKLRTQGDTT